MDANEHPFVATQSLLLPPFLQSDLCLFLLHFHLKKWKFQSICLGLIPIYTMVVFCHSGNTEELEIHINKLLLHPLCSLFVRPYAIEKSQYKVESGYYLQGLSCSKKKNNQTQALKNETIKVIFNKFSLFRCQFQSLFLQN